MRIGLALGVSLLAACAAVTPDPRQLLPPSLRTTPGESIGLRARVSGDAVYRCTATPGVRGALSWQLVEINGVLTTERGELLGTVSGLARWEGADGSSAVSAPGSMHPAMKFGAPPWTRFEIRQRDGQGAFGKASGVVLSDTRGGHPADLRCGYAQVSTELSFPYTGLVLVYEGGAVLNSQPTNSTQPAANQTVN